ncbi:TetR/AcrR family transcriptional regulator [Embleya sp. NPDC020886]|uniref:TetR/AcrR family transcriptional regulator n=1 Tax=Embleya sp. NPDC020886 TaxID=3363980 RepID=UPI003795D9A8
MTNETSAPEQILAAATELFHERSPAAVSLREIARRAGVNYGLIHHYFGTKEAVLAEVFRASSGHGGRLLADAEDTGTALARLGRDPRAYARMLAWAVLDSDTSKVFADESPAIRMLAELVGREWEAGPASDPARDRYDPRVVAATSVLAVLAWSVFAPYVFPAAGLADRDPDDVHAEVLDLLRDMIATTGPGPDRGSTDVGP